MTTLIDSVNQPITILSGSTTSPDEDAINLLGRTITKIYLPANFLGTKLYFDIARKLIDGTKGDFLPTINAIGEEIFVVVAPSLAVMLNPADFLGIDYFRIRSDVSQTSDVTIYLNTMRVT